MSEKAKQRIKKCLATQNPELDLSCCAITDLNELPKLLNCVHLERLDLEYNQIIDLSPLQKLYNLTVLKLWENQVRDIAPLQNLYNLTELRLNYNQITNLSPLRNLHNLTILELWGNQVRDITILQNLHNLTKLRLTDNQINDLTPLQNMQSLTELRLSYNQITNLSPLRNLYNLTWLELENNQLTDFSPLLLNEAYRSGKLKTFVRSNPNPILMNVVEQGYDALKAYYDELAIEGHIQNDQLKVILLGNSTAGKTSLLQFWGRKEFSETQITTHGIATPLELPLCLDNASETFRVNVWDFGGQDYYHATHRLFITPDSSYVLVCNRALENKSEQELTTEYIQVSDHIEAVDIPVQHYPYRFWLQTLAFLTKAGPIDVTTDRARDFSNLPKLFLVENKCGFYGSNLRMMHLDDALAKTLPFDVIGNDFYHLDIREAWRYHTLVDTSRKARQFYDGYLDFEATLVETLQAQIQTNRYEVHKNYPIIRDALASLAADQQQTEVSAYLNQLLADNKVTSIDQYEKLPVWITYAQYQDLVRRNSKSDDPHWLSLHIYLQNLCGRIFHFSDIPALADIVFIDPNWLHQTIYKVLSQEVLQNNGEFTLAEVDAVIDGNILDAARFMEVMKTFELVFEIPDQHPRRFVAPQYLPVTCPLTPQQLRKTKELYHQLALTLQFPYYLPPSLISRIISLKGHLIKAGEEPLWRNGLIYSKGGLSIFLLCTPDARQIEVFLSEADLATRQKALRQFMAFMEEKFSDEIAEVLIALPGVAGMAKWKHLYLAKKEQKTGSKNYDRSTGNELVDSRDFAFLFEDVERKPINMFLCYAHDDYADMLQFVEPLKKELASFANQNNIVINPFTDQQLSTGDRWHEVLQARIKENDLLICLLSPSFFNSDYIQRNEYGQVMREIAASERNSLVAPIYLKPCYVAEANPVGSLQFYKPLPSRFGLSNDIQDFCFHNLLHHNGGSYIRNYIKLFVESISAKLLAVWETK